MVNIIAAIDSNRGIGKNNQLLFKIPEDFERMKKLTMGHPIVMGRRTFESIGRKLPNRTSIVITRNSSSLKHLDYESDIVASSLEEAIEMAKKSTGSEEIFIFGGGQVFAEAIKKGLVDRLYLTVVEGDFGADTFFLDYSNFREIKREEKSDKNYKYAFVELTRSR